MDSRKTSLSSGNHPPALHTCSPRLPVQVSLVGHSAGAHMCTMALLHRALAASKSAAAPAAVAGQPSAGGASSNGSGSAAAPPAAPAAARAAQGQQAEATGAAAAMDSAEEAAAHKDPRMPCRLVAMAGVYDIAKHFEYEEGERDCLAWPALGSLVAGASMQPPLPVGWGRMRRCML